MSKRPRPSSQPRSSTSDAAKASPPPLIAVGWQVYALRVWLVVMIGATLWLTRPLWSDRATPPRLPLLATSLFAGHGFPGFDVFLFLSAAAFVYWPRAGLAAHIALGLTAMVDDQTRMQPQMFSFWLLMLGTIARPGAAWLGRCHLASLWFFSGLHKLLSANYYRDVAPFLWQGVFPAAAWPNVPNYATAFGAVSAAFEIALGVAVFVPRLRRAVAIGALGLHVSVVWLLHRQGDWNTSVWPWNLALAVVGATLVYTWRRSIADERRACGLAPFALGAALFFSPALYYVGLLDAYLSHCLYSANVPTAVFDPVAVGEPAYVINDAALGPYWQHLNVPQPPAHRIFAEYFRAVARPGDALLVEDPRAWAAWAGCDRYVWRRSELGVERMRLPPAAE